MISCTSGTPAAIPPLRGSPDKNADSHVGHVEDAGPGTSTNSPPVHLLYQLQYSLMHGAYQPVKSQNFDDFPSAVSFIARLLVDGYFVSIKAVIPHELAS